MPYASETMLVGYVWFKSGFPLPLHSHDADGFHQIIAGSMMLGTEELRRGDGGLIPAGAPYTVKPGREGIDFLGVRPTLDCDTRYSGKTDAYWAKDRRNDHGSIGILANRTAALRADAEEGRDHA